MIGGIEINKYDFPLVSIENLITEFRSFNETPKLRDIIELALTYYEKSHNISLGYQKERMGMVLEHNYLCYIISLANSKIRNFDQVDYQHVYDCLTDRKMSSLIEHSYLSLYQILFNENEIEKILKHETEEPAMEVTLDKKKDKNRVFVKEYLKNVNELYNDITKPSYDHLFYRVMKLFLLEIKYNHLSIMNTCLYGNKYILDYFDWDKLSKKYYYNISKTVYELMPIFLSELSSSQVKQCIKSSIRSSELMMRQFIRPFMYRSLVVDEDYIKIYTKKMQIKYSIVSNKQQMIGNFSIGKYKYTSVQAIVNAVFAKLCNQYNENHDDLKNYILINCSHQFILSY